MEVEQLRQQVALQAQQLAAMQQAMQQATATRAPIPQDLAELRSIIDTRVMEKVPTFDGTDGHFTEWRFAFEATCGLLGLEDVMIQSAESNMDDTSLNSYASGATEVALKNKAVYFL